MLGTKEVKKQLEPKIIKNIHFLYCILGCDTTSRLHGIGKRLPIKKPRESQEFEKVSEVFLKDDVLPNEIIENGEKALLILYNSKGVNSLNVLRHQRNPMNTLNPTHWGWKKENNDFFPIQTDISPAPQNLLKILR